MKKAKYVSTKLWILQLKLEIWQRRWKDRESWVGSKRYSVLERESAGWGI